MSSPPLACQHWTRTLLPKWGNTQSILHLTHRHNQSFFRCLCKRECLLTRILRIRPVVPWSKLSFWSWPLIALLWLTFNPWTLYSSSRDSIGLISSSSQQEKRYTWLRAVCLLLLRLCTQFGLLSISFPPWRLLKLWFSNHNFYFFLSFYDLRNLRWILLILGI